MADLKINNGNKKKKTIVKKSYQRRLIHSSVSPPEFPNFNWTDRRVKFCWAYVETGSKREAAEAAGYSPRTAAQNGTKVFGKEPIQAYITKIFAHYEVTVDKVVRELCCIAFSDARDYVDEENKPINLKQLNKFQAAAVEGIEVTKTKMKLTRYNKVESLKMLARYLGIELEKTKAGKEIVSKSGSTDVDNRFAEAVRNATPDRIKQLRSARRSIMDDHVERSKRDNFKIVH